MDRRSFIKKIGAGSLVAGTVMAGATPALAAKKRDYYFIIIRTTTGTYLIRGWIQG